jgi:5-methylcytosine-specific restriction endonuclease McrBC regulatory subunit McrC
VGPVLQETGWAASPDFLDLPLVPGSGREVPPWVLAGPVLARLERLLHNLRPGYEYLEERRQSPRGTLLWPVYAQRCLPSGRWHQLPCRFPDLRTDPTLRQAVRWTLERIQRDLAVTGGSDTVALALSHTAARLLDLVRDVVAVMPSRDQLERQWGGGPVSSSALRHGIQAIAWIVDERGLGGGRQLHGLAWKLTLEQLWEHYIEALYRREASLTGGEVRCGRRRQTTIPIHWSDPMHRSLGHLVPDLVIRRGRQVQIVDAKYKAHFAELDVAGWYRLEEDLRASHRADVHQVLAYAGLVDADDVTATLAYPLRRETWAALRDRGRDTSSARVFAGNRSVGLELRGVPFGGSVGTHPASG